MWRSNARLSGNYCWMGNRKQRDVSKQGRWISYWGKQGNQVCGDAGASTQYFLLLLKQLGLLLIVNYIQNVAVSVYVLLHCQ